jgi:predicted TIM-barrel fold metal-dependent hydrolase
MSASETSPDIREAREYNQRLPEVRAKYPGRFYGTANIPLKDTNQAIAIVDEAVKEFGLVGANPAAVTADGFTDASRREDFYTLVEEVP